MKNQNLKKIAVVGVLSALSVVFVMLVHFPIFPAVSFLEYDGADIPIMLCTFLFGSGWGFAMTVAVSIIQGFTVSAASGVPGIVMHIFATGSLVLVTGLIAKKNPSTKRRIVSCVSGIAAMTLSMTLWNMIITPKFMNVPLSVLMPLMPLIVAFNIIKGTANVAIALIIYKTLYKFLNFSKYGL